ncbi:MAG: hypothetical protein P4L91_12935 [Burkholderiaceae bacterium]|nr:hypothetical protein [Burkholderiaceae bacterium]
MKLVDNAGKQLAQLLNQVANREAAMKRDAANAALIQFKTYFANREFSFTGNEWQVTATHGSIVFALTIKNAQTGGPECLILKFPEMTKRTPLNVYLETRSDEAPAAAPAATDTSKSALEEVQDQIAQAREKLASPAKKWLYFTLMEAQRKEYMTVTRLLETECP